MSDNSLTGIRQEANDGKLKDTLFGPSIGVVNPGPGWAHSTVGGGVGVSGADGKAGATLGGEDVLTTDVVKKWVAKSKEVCVPSHGSLSGIGNVVAVRSSISNEAVQYFLDAINIILDVLSHRDKTSPRFSYFC